MPTTPATPNDLLWPPAAGPSSLDEIERIPLEQRGLPESTYELVARAARLWPDRPATSVLADGEHWQMPATRTFAELAGDVHRAAGALHELGVGRGDAVAVISVNCAALLSVLLAAEAVGIYAPINPELSVEHATELVRLSGAGVIVASGPELEPRLWSHAREIAAQIGARALLALRSTGAAGPAPALEPLEGSEVAYLDERMAHADDGGLPGMPPALGGRRQLPAHRRHHGDAEAGGAHPRKRGRQRMDDLLRRHPRRGQRGVRGAAAVPHQRAAGDHCWRRCCAASTWCGRGRSATATRRCSATSGTSSSATGSARCPASRRSTPSWPNSGSTGTPRA